MSTVASPQGAAPCSDPATVTERADRLVRARPPFRFAWPVRVRLADTDAMGVMYHGAYLRYLEAARVEYIRNLGISYRQQGFDAGILVAVGELHLRYHAPARYDDLLAVQTRIARLGPASLRYEYEVWRAEDERLVLSGWTVNPFLDRATLRPTAVPAWLRQAIRAFEGGERPA